jgi:hypothetical protein
MGRLYSPEAAKNRYSPNLCTYRRCYKAKEPTRLDADWQGRCDAGSGRCQPRRVRARAGASPSGRRNLDASGPPGRAQGAFEAIAPVGRARLWAPTSPRWTGSSAAMTPGRDCRLRAALPRKAVCRLPRRTTRWNAVRRRFAPARAAPTPALCSRAERRAASTTAAGRAPNRGHKG